LLRGAKELEEFIMGGIFKEGPENKIIANVLIFHDARSENAKQKLGGTGFSLADSFDRYPDVFNHLGGNHCLHGAGPIYRMVLQGERGDYYFSWQGSKPVTKDRQSSLGTVVVRVVGTG
jgi:hypothetical protein